MNKKLLMLSMALSMSSLAFAQTKVTGTIKDAAGEPIIGASVTVKGANGVGTISDLDGNFTLTVPAGKKQLEVSYIGYTSQSVNVAGKNSLQIVLKEDSQTLNELVVVGYGTMKKSDLAGASASMDEKSLKQVPITNVDQAFQGRISGVTATQTSGQPGSAVSVNVRGIATINANTEPLYVVDGVIFNSQSNSGSSLGLGDALGNGPHSAVSPLSLINPSDIVSMEVLKDASATAIYGSQGANGVVLITTKKGKAGDAKFNYTGSVTVSRQNKRLDMLNLRDFASFYNTLAAFEGEISQRQELQRPVYPGCRYKLAGCRVPYSHATLPPDFRRRWYGENQLLRLR